jgi:hypothetical protein
MIGTESGVERSSGGRRTARRRLSICPVARISGGEPDKLPNAEGEMDLKGLADKAKQIFQQRGGAPAAKQDAQELRDIAQGQGSTADKAKEAAAAIKDPGAPGPDESQGAGGTGQPSDPQGQAGGTP